MKVKFIGSEFPDYPDYNAGLTLDKIYEVFDVNERGTVSIIRDDGEESALWACEYEVVEE